MKVAPSSINNKKIVVRNQNDEENSVEYNESCVLTIFKEELFYLAWPTATTFEDEYKHRHSLKKREELEGFILTIFFLLLSFLMNMNSRKQLFSV